MSDVRGMMEIRVGQKIVVYDSSRRELGEGTFIRATQEAELNLIAYECQEHTILAKGDHYVRLAGTLHFVETRLD